MKRTATVMVLGLTLLAVGKFSPLASHWGQVVVDQGGDTGDDSRDDDGDDSRT